MSAASDKSAATAARLRKQLATAEATAEHLRAKLAAIAAKEAGAPPPVLGLDLLWQAALPISRIRSSKVQCRAEWNRIEKDERPTVAAALAALKIWNRCEEWKKDGNQFAPALHRWIKNRQWENLPEDSRPAPSRYRTTPQNATGQVPGEAITDAAEIAKLLSIRAPRMNS